MLIGIGLAAFAHEINSAQEPLIAAAQFTELLELLVFVLLLTVTLSRLVTALRRGGLGYKFYHLIGRRDQEGDLDIAAHYEVIKHLAWGGLPLDHTKRWQEFADAIANQSAKLLSERSLFLRDTRWMRRERETFGEWFRALPAALWRVPVTDAESAATPANAAKPNGYMSVIVPVTRVSWRSISRGWRATDLAEVDRDAMEALLQKRQQVPFRNDVYLLAYLHIYCEPRELPDPPPLEESRLIGASLQHLAYMLFRFFGNDNKKARQRWTFVIICESANRYHSNLLERLGFTPVEVPDTERSRTVRRHARSFADFPLYEFVVREGEPISAEQADAQRFLVLLEELVLAYTQREAASVTDMMESGVGPRGLAVQRNELVLLMRALLLATGHPQRLRRPCKTPAHQRPPQFLTVCLYRKQINSLSRIGNDSGRRGSPPGCAEACCRQQGQVLSRADERSGVWCQMAARWGADGHQPGQMPVAALQPRETAVASVWMKENGTTVAQPSKKLPTNFAEYQRRQASSL